MIQNYLINQKRQLQGYLFKLLVDVGISSGRTLGLGALTLLIFAGTLEYTANAKERANWVVGTGAIAAALAGISTWVSLEDAKADFECWKESNSGKRRAQLMQNSLDGQMEALNQQALMWSVQQQTAFNWQMQQRYGQQAQAQTITVAPEAPAIPAALPSTFDPAYSLGTDPSSAIIAGVPGSGKGTTAANALNYFKRERPDAQVFVIDPKADPKEVGNWAAADVVWSQKIKLMNPEAVKDWVERCLEQFLQHSGPKLLIMDEGSAVLATLKQLGRDGMAQFKSFLSHITSMGDSESEYLWLLVQIVHAEDLGLSGGYRSMPRAIAIASPKNRQALNAFLDTKFVPRPKAEENTIDELMQLSPCGRAVFDGQTARWYPLAPLPNVCGYDRDSRRFEAGQQKPATGIQSNVIELPVTQPKTKPTAKPAGDMAAWWSWLGEQSEGVTVRHVQQKAPRSLRFNDNGKTVSAAYVRSLFAYFSSIGFGLATNDGGTFTPRC